MDSVIQSGLGRSRLNLLDAAHQTQRRVFAVGATATTRATTRGRGRLGELLTLREDGLVETLAGVLPVYLVCQGVFEVEFPLGRVHDVGSVVLETQLVEGERLDERRDHAVTVVPAGLLDQGVDQLVQTLFDAADERQGVLADVFEGLGVDVVGTVGVEVA